MTATADMSVTGAAVGSRGACTVLVDGHSVSSRLTRAARCGSTTVTTADGLPADDDVVDGFVTAGAVRSPHSPPQRFRIGLPMIVWTTQGKLNVHRTGDAGQPVVLLHPLALSGAMFDPFAEYLAANGHTVFATDARGHGDSGWDGNPFTVEDLADDTAAMVDTLGVGPVDVVGLSMGGSTALVFAAAHPGLVRRLVVADASADYGPDGERVWAERATRAETVGREEQLSFQWDRWFSSGFRATNAAEVNRISQIFLTTDSRAHAAACHALGALDATDRLADIGADTLVLVGEEDHATPVTMAEEIAKRVPSARLEVLERARHLSLVERTDAWPAITAFLG